MIDFERLRQPFHANEIEWRIGRAGQNAKGIWATAFAYVTNRAIMQRLDEVCGPGNWRNEFVATPNDPEHKSVLCGLSIRIENEWVTKWDGADNSDMEPTKGGLSDSMKRAAVQWGIGRYLYDLEEGWVETSADKQKDWRYQPANEKKKLAAFYWQPPQLPAWALPGTPPPPPPTNPSGKKPSKPDPKKLAAEHGMKTGDQIEPSMYAQLKAKLDAIKADDPDVRPKLSTAEDFIHDQHKKKQINDRERDELNFMLAEIQREVDSLQPVA